MVSSLITSYTEFPLQPEGGLRILNFSRCSELILYVLFFWTLFSDTMVILPWLLPSIFYGFHCHSFHCYVHSSVGHILQKEILKWTFGCVWNQVPVHQEVVWYITSLSLYHRSFQPICCCISPGVYLPSSVLVGAQMVINKGIFWLLKYPNIRVCETYERVLVCSVDFRP